MPELPEVQTVITTLESLIKDRAVTAVHVHYSKMIATGAQHLETMLPGQHFRRFLRRGKYGLLVMDEWTLIVHLRMEGKFYVQNPDEPYDKHVHVRFDLDDGRQLRYHDTRKFGRMELVATPADFTDFKGLGPEPFWDSFNAVYLKEQLKRRRLPLKQVLLDQHLVAGIGNIYANEICFAIGMDPRQRCDRLTAKQREDCVVQTRRVLEEAIAAGGTTIRSYTSSLGVDGLFQLKLNVHGRQGEQCPNCQTPIVKIVVGQRGTYYCPGCQKKR